MGSVKDLTVLEPAGADKPGRGRFTFSDRYSVFDWGEMPDLIKDKGAALTLIGAWFFEELERAGMKTHYLGLVEDGVPQRLADLKKPSNVMDVKLLNVIRPKLEGEHYDYSMYRPGMRNYLVPLEVIYRNSLPEGSSVFKRLASGQTTPADLGLAAMPVPGQKCEPPIFDVSTKLEITDRYLSWNEAEKISGLEPKMMKELRGRLLFVNRLISQAAGRMGLVNEDGKIELGIDENGELLTVDVLGTPDECRFTHAGIPVSKEVCRIWYRKSAWYGAVEEAKKKDRMNWKSITAVKPEALPPRLSALVSGIYCSFCNGLTGRRWFDVPPLADVLKEIREFV
jgi:phosphoribosylaminoimidazole-succinocarboxamide synthase